MTVAAMNSHFERGFIFIAAIQAFSEEDYNQPKPTFTKSN